MKNFFPRGQARLEIAHSKKILSVKVNRASLKSTGGQIKRNYYLLGILIINL
jgi:hypothetical protein